MYEGTTPGPNSRIGPYRAPRDEETTRAGNIIISSSKVPHKLDLIAGAIGNPHLSIIIIQDVCMYRFCEAYQSLETVGFFAPSPFGSIFMDIISCSSKIAGFLGPTRGDQPSGRIWTGHKESEKNPAGTCNVQIQLLIPSTLFVLFYTCWNRL